MPLFGFVQHCNWDWKQMLIRGDKLLESSVIKFAENECLNKWCTADTIAYACAESQATQLTFAVFCCPILLGPNIILAFA